MHQLILKLDYLVLREVSSDVIQVFKKQDLLDESFSNKIIFLVNGVVHEFKITDLVNNEFVKYTKDTLFDVLTPWLQTSNTPTLGLTDAQLRENPVDVNVVNQIDLTTITSHLLSIKNSCTAINENTDTIEAKITDTITAINANGTVNHDDLLLILAQLQAVNANTDTLEAGLTSILNKIIAAPATLAEQQNQTATLAQILATDIFQIQKGLVDGVSMVMKSGRNSNITSSSAPEDIWNGSTLYTGFPTGAPEVLQFFSSNAGDTGVVTYQYLATSSSTVWQTATVTLNGTTPVSGVSAYRVHTASYDNGGGVNLGTITCRHSVTIANIFFHMPVGTCQTYVSAYTIPAGSTGFVKKAFASVSTTNTVTLQGALYIREHGKSPRLRRNFDFSDRKKFSDDKLFLKLNEKTDITVRLTSSSSNTAQVIVGGFDLVLINQIL